jgi:hypothetical protein
VSSRAVLVAAAIAIVAVVAGVMAVAYRPAPAPVTALGPMPSLDGVAGWVNGRPRPRQPLTALVLWSDTDPRSLRAMDDAAEWSRLFGPHGVSVVGVHLPEFSYGADTAIAARIVRRLGIGFPIALDPAYSLSSALPPAAPGPRVLIGNTLGEMLLDSARDPRDPDRFLRLEVARRHPELGWPTDTTGLSTRSALHEPRFIHLGTSRAEAGPLAGATPGTTQAFTTQFRFQEETSAGVPIPVGRWTPRVEGLECARGGPECFVALRQRGETVLAVMSPPPPFASAPRVWVLLDDRWLGRNEAGGDVRFDGRGASYVELDGPRLYSIARGKKGVLRLSPDTDGTTLYSFVLEDEK